MWPFDDRVPQPTKDHVQRGTKLWFQVDARPGSHSGNVRDEKGVIYWQYGSRKTNSSYSSSNPFRKPDFVFHRADNSAEAVVRRASFVPSLFHVLEANRVIGNLRMRSVFRNRYSFSIDGIDWRFHMPLYTIRFYGNSTAGGHVWATLGQSKKLWAVLMDPDIEPKAPMIAVLAFIHSEWWSYS